MKDTRKPLKDGEKENVNNMDCFYFLNRQILEIKFVWASFFILFFIKLVRNKFKHEFI